MKSISQLEDTSIFTLFRNLTVSNFRERAYFQVHLVSGTIKD